jgi:hypothetical protein
MKRICCLALACLLLYHADAQRYSAALGPSDYGTLNAGWTDFNSMGVTFCSRLALEAREHWSFSLDMPVTLGVSTAHAGDYWSRFPYDEHTFSFDVPVYASFNFGAGSSRSCEDKVGFFAGVGLGFHFINGNRSGWTDTTHYIGFELLRRRTVGPVMDGGVRLGMGHHRRSFMELRLAFAPMNALQVTTFSVLFSLGKYHRR